MSDIAIKDLYNWCKVPVDQLMDRPDLKIPFRLLNNSDEMGEVMAGELVEDVKAANAAGKPPRFSGTVIKINYSVS